MKMKEFVVLWWDVKKNEKIEKEGRERKEVITSGSGGRR